MLFALLDLQIGEKFYEGSMLAKKYFISIFGRTIKTLSK